MNPRFARVRPDMTVEEAITDYLPDGVTLLPNTAGSATAGAAAAGAGAAASGCGAA